MEDEMKNGEWKMRNGKSLELNSGPHLPTANCRLRTVYSGPICVGTMSFGERDVLMIGGESKR
jgi:hypothetical protein